MPCTGMAHSKHYIVNNNFHHECKFIFVSFHLVNIDMPVFKLNLITRNVRRLELNFDVSN
jgi:hypothetical protein